MADVTQRMSAQEYLASVCAGQRTGGLKRKAKYGNRRIVTEAGLKYDSGKELRHHQLLEASKSAMDPAQRVARVVRQVPYVLLEKQDGERAVKYVADFVVTYADGRVEVHDTKSPPTRADKTYVLKRKLMLAVHGIRIQEF